MFQEEGLSAIGIRNKFLGHASDFSIFPQESWKTRVKLGQRKARVIRQVSERAIGHEQANVFKSGHTKRTRTYPSRSTEAWWASVSWHNLEILVLRATRRSKQPTKNLG